MGVQILLIHAWLILVLQAFYAGDLTPFQSRMAPVKPIKIGLLITDHQSYSAKHGAEMSIQLANSKGGLHGIPFQLVVRSMEGPWGTGSKQAVSLIFDEDVWALLGSHDGRNAHLVEQVAAKSRIVFLSAWASDPTLSQAFVPWYFSCVPNDLQQADALIKEIYNKMGINKLALISIDDYDSQLAQESFLKRIKPAGKPDPVKLFYNPSVSNLEELLDQISKAKINGVVLLGKLSIFKPLIEQLDHRKMNLSIFGSLSLLGDEQIPDPKTQKIEKLIQISSANWSLSKTGSFSQAYHDKFGSSPDAIAAYAFDGMNIIIEAIRNTGNDREMLQKSMSAIHLKGVTGLVRFDGNGNRDGNVAVVRILNGLPVAASKD